MTENLSQIIENAFEKRAEINLQTKGEVRDAVNQTLALLDGGKIRVCEKNQILGRSISGSKKPFCSRLDSMITSSEAADFLIKFR